MAFTVTTGANTGGVTTGTVAVAVPGGSAAAGDLLMVVFESQTGNPGPNLAGWTTLQSTLLAALSGTTRLTIGFRIADGTEGATQTFTLPVTVNHASGQMAKITGHGITAMADIIANGGTAAAGATFSTGAPTVAVSGVTSLTVTPGSLVFLVVGDALDTGSTTQFSSWAVATDPGTLGTEDFDNLVITGNGGGIGMAHGICAGTSTGTGSVTRASNADAWNAMLIGIKPLVVAAAAPTMPLLLTLQGTPLQRFLGFPRFPETVGAAPQTFLQDVIATTAATTATMQRQVNKPVTATTATTTASIQKQVSKLITATTVTSLASIVKLVSKAVTATTVTTTASIVALKVILKVLTATTVTTTATIQKQVNKLLTATTATTTATIRKQVNKAVTATTVTTTATLQALKVILKALTANVTSTATMTRQVSKLVTATVTTAPTIVKQVAKRMTATTVSSTASVVAQKVILKALTATITATASIAAVFIAGGAAVVKFFMRPSPNATTSTGTPGGGQGLGSPGGGIGEGAPSSNDFDDPDPGQL